MSIFVGGESIDMRLTLMDSAQCFHWIEHEDRFGAVISGRPIWLWQNDGGIYADGCDNANILREYLDLNRDYSRIAEEYSAYPRAAECVRLYPGLRVLNQPAWETLVTFIISANNNVSRIRKLVMKVCERFGERCETPLGDLCTFPAPAILAGCAESELRELGMGYRDKYLVRTARAVADGFPIEELRHMPYEDAHKLLLTLMGVGDKVADCVQLFGCGHSEAFPVDVWIARMLKAVFGMDCANRRQLGRDARAILGKDAGILQQFLFHASRTGMLLV